MRDFILSFPDEQVAITVLAEYRQSVEEQGWKSSAIPGCTRWVTRSVYDEDGELITPPETVPGWHCIIRAESLPEAAQPFVVTDPGDIEPIPAGGLLKPVVPQVVSRFQARVALHIHGVLADVEVMIQAADPIAQMAWADAQQFERPSPTIAAIAAALGWTDEFVDRLFITAGSISA